MYKVVKKKKKMGEVCGINNVKMVYLLSLTRFTSKLNRISSSICTIRHDSILMLERSIITCIPDIVT